MGLTREESNRYLEVGILTEILRREDVGLYRFYLYPSEKVREAIMGGDRPPPLALESLGQSLGVWDRALLLPKKILARMDKAFRELGHLPFFTPEQYAQAVGIHKGRAYSGEIQLGITAGFFERGPVENSFSFRKTQAPFGWASFDELKPGDPIPHYLREFFGHVGHYPFNSSDVQDKLYLGSRTLAVRLINAGRTAKVLRVVHDWGVYAFDVPPPVVVASHDGVSIPPEALDSLRKEGVDIPAWDLLYRTNYRLFTHYMDDLILSGRPGASMSGSNRWGNVRMDRGLLAGVLAPSTQEAEEVVFAAVARPRGWAAFESLGRRGDRDLDFIRRALHRFRDRRITVKDFTDNLGTDSDRKSSKILINASLAGVMKRSLKGSFLFHPSVLEDAEDILNFYALLRRISAPQEVWHRAYLLDPTILNAMVEGFPLAQDGVITQESYRKIRGGISKERAQWELGVATVGGLLRPGRTRSDFIFREVQSPVGFEAFNAVGKEFDFVVEGLLQGALHFQHRTFSFEELTGILDLESTETAEDVLNLGLLSRTIRTVDSNVYLFDRVLFTEEKHTLLLYQFLGETRAPRLVWKRALRLERPAYSRVVAFFRRQGYAPFSIFKYGRAVGLYGGTAWRDVKLFFTVGLLERRPRGFSFRKSEGPSGWHLLSETSRENLNTADNDLRRAFEIFGWRPFSPAELSRVLGGRKTDWILEMGYLSGILNTIRGHNTYVFEIPPP